jgi:hypothetical protein
MASQYGIERDRGAKESSEQLATLRGKWPLAFPAKPHDIRPLAIGAAGEIAAAMGWSLPYTFSAAVHASLNRRCRLAGSAMRRVGDAAEVQDPDHHFVISQLSAAMRSRNGFNALSLSSIFRMRASAAASFCLSVAISAAAVAARSAMIAFVSRGRADRALPPSGFANIFGDKAVIPSRHCRGNDPPGGCRDFPAQRGAAIMPSAWLTERLRDRALLSQPRRRR